MTFFVGEAIRFSISNTPEFTRGMLGLSVAPFPDVFGIDFGRSNLYAYYYLLLVLTAVIMGFMWWLVKSRYGLAFEALREDKLATQSLRSEEHTSELQSLMRSSYAVFCLKK